MDASYHLTTIILCIFSCNLCTVKVVARLWRHIEPEYLFCPKTKGWKVNKDEESGQFSVKTVSKYIVRKK